MAKYLSIDGVARLLSNIAKKYSKVGHTHQHDEIKNLPPIPTKLSELVNDRGFINSDMNTTYQLISEEGYIKLVGSDGSLYRVEIGDIFSIDGGLSEDSSNPVENKVITEAIKELVPKTRMINNIPLTEDIYLSAEMLGAEIAGTAEAKIDTHNTDGNAHYDLRMEVQELSNRLNTVADSDDSTLDQLSEIVDYAKANENLIYSITTQKVNVTDIVDNLETTVSNKPLSARQGTIIASKLDELEDHLRSKTDVQIITWEADD